MQQSDSIIPHNRWQFVYFALAGILGYGANWFQAWLQRKKPAAEIHETEARTRKTEAEARQIDWQLHRMQGSTLLEAYDSIRNAQLRIDQLVRERDEWRALAESEQAARRLIEMELDGIKQKTKVIRFDTPKE